MSQTQILYQNSTNQIVDWVNSSEKTIVIIVYNQQGSTVSASRLLPHQSISILPSFFIEQLEAGV
ncbi:MAG: hypothetical protein QNJ34_11140 [Xenococcaceae cyanobacterium MO_188.B29]|nr:hypothetical protein [Xenococcaceae cyanobacterium MO_188.B29]